MIHTVAVLNYEEALRARVWKDAPMPLFWVSITDPDVDPIMEDGRYVATAQFWDVDERAPIEYFKKAISFSQARKIVDVIDRAHAHEKPVMLVAHCMTGISRSGGVARYVADSQGRSPRIWSSRGLIPNLYVVKMLARAKVAKDTFAEAPRGL